MEGCNLCQRIKNYTEPLVGKLMANKVLEKLQIYLTVEFITKFPLVAVKDTILVVCDRLSKITYFVTTTKEILVERLARLFRDNMQKLYKLPESVIFNKDLQFAVDLIREFIMILSLAQVCYRLTSKTSKISTS